ncbi:hypothetical protein AB0L00_26330 [Actinoallomurus sp. NPDC052308]|uniref:hypothetical protein n=1 Tax=Actinoallomurus sp. NPDC052308 TaxID=3155530 RepID=UPI00342CDE31
MVPSPLATVTASAAIGSLCVLVAAAVSSLAPATASPDRGGVTASAAGRDPWPAAGAPDGAGPRRREPRRTVRAPMADPGPRPRPTPAPTATATVTASPTATATATATVTATASPSATASASATTSASAKSDGINVSIGASPSASASRTPTAFPRPRRTPLKNFIAGCDPRVYFRLRFQKPVDLFVPDSYYVDGPGGDIQVWIRRVHLVRLHVELEKEVDTDVTVQNFLARVRKELRPEVEQEHSVESGHQYTVHVTKGMIGHVRYRVFGLKVGFDEWKIFHNCGRLRINTGVATFPTIREGWKFWETKAWPTVGEGRKTGRGAREAGQRPGQARVGRPTREITGREPRLERELTEGHGGQLRRHEGESPSKTAGERK